MNSTEHSVCRACKQHRSWQSQRTGAEGGVGIEGWITVYTLEYCIPHLNCFRRYPLPNEARDSFRLPIWQCKPNSIDVIIHYRLFSSKGQVLKQSRARPLSKMQQQLFLSETLQSCSRSKKYAFRILLSRNKGPNLDTS
jgi:hypothetical protein